jgi:hypothetical protein
MLSDKAVLTCHGCIMRGSSFIVLLAAFLVSGEARAAGPLDLVVEYSADTVVGTGEQARPGKLDPASSGGRPRRCVWRRRRTAASRP